MSETDNPLKLLITQFADAFAAWLLPQPIEWIRPLNVEFPATPLRSDLLFEVMAQDGRLQDGKSVVAVWRTAVSNANPLSRYRSTICTITSVSVSESKRTPSAISSSRSST